MIKNKYFKVKKVKRFDSSVIYKVFGYNTWLDFIFGLHYSEYTKDNNSIDGAIAQIDEIVKEVVVEEETVYKRKV